MFIEVISSKSVLIRSKIGLNNHLTEITFLNFPSFHSYLEFQLQGTRTLDAGGDHGHAHLLRLGIRLGEERGGHEVHLHAAGNYRVAQDHYSGSDGRMVG